MTTRNPWKDLKNMSESIKCARCWKDTEVFIERNIISRDRHPVTRKAILKEERLKFCCEQCANCHQMSMEG